MYDYGDEWAHVLKLEKVDPEPCLHPRVLADKYELPRRTAAAGTKAALRRSISTYSTATSPSGQPSWDKRPKTKTNKADPYPRLMS